DRAGPLQVVNTVKQTAYFATPEGKYAQGDSERGVFTDLLVEVLRQFQGWPEQDLFVRSMEAEFQRVGETPFRISVFSENEQTEMRLVGPIPTPRTRLRGIDALPPDYASRIQNFLAEYLGSPKHPVPFGGRQESLGLLDAWLDGAKETPYSLLAAPAGRGKSALLVRWTRRLLSRQDVAGAFGPGGGPFRTNLAGVVFPALAARPAA